MTFHDISVKNTLDAFCVNAKNGLSKEMVLVNREKYGENLLQKKKKRGFFRRFFDALKEPMLIILHTFSFDFLLSCESQKFQLSYQIHFIIFLQIIKRILYL